MSINYAIIVASGKGKRMGADINKVFINIKDKPILAYTIEAFERNVDIDNIIIVASKDEINYCEKEIVEKYGFTKVKRIVAGGSERQKSVINGLKAIQEKLCDIILIHDGARPFVNSDIIKNGIRYAGIYGACACGVKPKDTIKIKDNNGMSKCTLDRDSLIAVQTPQCFKYQLILKAHIYAESENFKATDDTAIAEFAGNKVFLYEGSYVNTKITTPEDLVLGTKIADNMSYWHFIMNIV